MPDSIFEKRLAVPVKLDLPGNLSKDEESAVIGVLNKWRHNRFYIKSDQNKIEMIRPYSIVDLLRIDDLCSLTRLCGMTTEKRWKIDEIPEKNIGMRENFSMRIVDNENLSKGFVCCVLLEDMVKFVERMQQVSDYGKALANIEPYQPEKFEICFALQFDDDGTEVWYRAQFQQELSDGRAQVGLIDFGVSTIIKMSNIRKFAEQFSFERVNFIGKIRCTNNSLDLLDLDQFNNFNIVTATLLEPFAHSFELHFDDTYFIEDENNEEEMLRLED